MIDHFQLWFMTVKISDHIIFVIWSKNDDLIFVVYDVYDVRKKMYR